jgi:hypothetical protein
MRAPRPFAHFNRVTTRKLSLDARHHWFWLAPLAAALAVLALQPFGSRSELPQLSSEAAASELWFRANEGAAPQEVLFVARGADYELAITRGGAVLALSRAHGAPRLSLSLPGADRTAAIVPEQPRGGDRDVFGRVRYAGIYPGIDLLFYSVAGRFEYDFYIAPGVDPARVRLLFGGVDRIDLDAAGNLRLCVADVIVTQLRPLAYQTIDGARRSVLVEYRLLPGAMVTFAVGRYDEVYPLVIDPALTVSGDASRRTRGHLRNGDPVMARHAFITRFARSGQRLWTTSLGGDGGEVHVQESHYERSSVPAAVACSCS